MRLTNFVAKWPGSAHDLYILINNMMSLRLLADGVASVSHAIQTEITVKSTFKSSLAV